MADGGFRAAASPATEVRPPGQRRAVAKLHRRTWRDRVDALFPADPGPTTRWFWLVLAVVIGAVISLGRVPYGPGVLNTIWAEDGANFLTDALNRNPAATIVRPLNGYFVVVPRLLAVPAGLVPVGLAPAVLTIEAALVTGLMAMGVYVASRAHLQHPLARLVAAVPVVAVPVAANVAAEASNNVATLQFAALYLGLWMVLWNPGRPARIAAAAAVVAIAASTFLAVVLMPLAVLRWYARRDAVSATMVGGLLLGLAANVTALSIHLTARPVMLPSRYDPLWALSTVVQWALPHAMFGYGLSGNGAQKVDPHWLVWLAWPLLLTVLLVSLGRLTRPQWKLAIVLSVTALGLLAGTVMQYGGTELRYVIAPELMLFAALAGLLLPRPEGNLGQLPLVVLSVCVLLVLAASYRTAGPRANLSAWSDSVAQARIVCGDGSAGGVYVYPGDGSVRAVPHGTPLRRDPPPGFPVLIPCARLR
jgi:hypothetical protein